MNNNPISSGGYSIPATYTNYDNDDGLKPGKNSFQETACGSSGEDFEYDLTTEKIDKMAKTLNKLEKQENKTSQPVDPFYYEVIDELSIMVFNNDSKGINEVIDLLRKIKLDVLDENCEVRQGFKNAVKFAEAAGMSDVVTKLSMVASDSYGNRLKKAGVTEAVAEKPINNLSNNMIIHNGNGTHNRHYNNRFLDFSESTGFADSVEQKPTSSSFKKVVKFQKK